MRRIQLAGIAVLALAACSKSSSPQPPAALTIGATVTSGEVAGAPGVAVKADGASVVNITVSGSTAGPIKLATRQGTFPGGSTTAQIDGTSGSVDLTVCDARTTTGCSGPVRISAIDASGAFGQTTVNFVGFETNCKDGKDNNGDGLIDCADPDCDQAACVTAGGAGICQNQACVLPTCTPSGPEICTNGLDDDCDGKIDCAATSCDGQPCKAGYPSFICQSKVCTDVTTGYGLTLTTARSRLPANGVTQTTLTLKVLANGSPAAGARVDLTTDLGGFAVGAATAPTASVSTRADGTATVAFVASATPGVATVTATLGAVQLTQSTMITMPALGSIQLATSQNNGVMGIKYSGWYEQNQISVLLLDDKQLPYPDGLAVHFQHQQLGGSAITTPWSADTATCQRASNCLGYDAQTTSPAGKPDTGGHAYVDLYSGTTQGLVSVSVTAIAGGVTRTFTVQNIAIVGAKASGGQISLDCTPKNVPALIDHDCLHTFYGGSGTPIQCTVHFADRFGNVLGRSVLATFASEAGAAGQPVWTAAYDPAQGTGNSKLGYATNTIAVDGYGLPRDVAPFAGEPSLTLASPDLCGKTTINPRDGLVTVIVMAKGEEGFVDQNGNGVWDPGEPFIDVGEPFVDANDDGVWQPGEAFVDLNGNGKYDGPNGVWDADTTIWTETRVMYSGLPAFGPGFSLASPASLQFSAPGSSQADFVFRDENLNPLAPKFSTYAASAVNAKVTMKLLSPTSVDNLGLGFSLQYCDHPAGSGVPTTCSSQCSTSPCYVVTTIPSFSGGSAGVVTVSGQTAATDVVNISPTTGGITVTPGLAIPVTVN